MSCVAILLVDDEKTILDSLRMQLRSMFGSRFLYETAENVEEAWEVIDELQDDGDVSVVLVVSDWLMPGTRGDRFLADLRQRFPDIARILLTGQADASAVMRARTEARVHRVLRKPWSADVLRSTIESALPAPS
jgi:DNA-binding NtrC family response regulator